MRYKTGVDAPYLEQLGSWGSAKRDPRGWSTTHVYFALIPSDHLDRQRAATRRIHAGSPSQAIGFSQELAFDHAVLLKAAVARLRAKVEYTSLPVYLMSDEFTLTELQHTYEILLSRQLEKKAFRTRLLAAGLLDPVPRMKIGSNRPAQLYQSNQRRRRPHMFSRPFGSAQPSLA